MAKSKGKDKGKHVGNIGPRADSGGLLGTYFKRLPSGPPPDNGDARRGPAASADAKGVDDDDNERSEEVSYTPGAARFQDKERLLPTTLSSRVRAAHLTPPSHT